MAIRMVLALDIWLLLFLSSDWFQSPPAYVGCGRWPYGSDMSIISIWVISYAARYIVSGV